jgi:2-octaprenyl-6-methoxyphenol hydroxylase
MIDTASHNQPMRYDVAVVGVGAAGLCMAYASAQKGLSTVLIGSPAPPAHGRTVALFTQAIAFFKEVGLWPFLENNAYPLEKLRIIDVTHNLFRAPALVFDAQDIGLEAIGYSFELSHLLKQLSDAVDVHDQITIIPSRVTGMTLETNGRTLTLEDGSCVNAKLVIAADGRSSFIRECANIPIKAWDYRQVALTVRIQHTREQGAMSTELHTRHGPFTWVPLNAHTSGLVWLTTPDEGKVLNDLSDTALAKRIRDQAQGLLGDVTCDNPRQIVPMSGMNAQYLTASHLALIGETAHAFPPIGAQGLNMTLADCYALTTELSTSFHDLETALKRYDKARKTDIRIRTTLVDGLNRALLTPLLPLDFARSAGLHALKTLSPLRRIIMKAGLRR